MSRTVGKLDVTLQSICDRIIAQVQLSSVAVFKAESCYLSLHPEHVGTSPGNFTCVVCPPEAGNFDEGMMDGGGASQATMHGDIRIGIHSPVQLDELNHEANWLKNASLGIMEIWRQVLKCLTTFDPVDGSGNEQLRDQLMPGGFQIQRRKKSIGYIIQNFKHVGDIDLT